MFLTILTTAAAIIGLVSGDWTSGDVHKGIGYSCSLHDLKYTCDSFSWSDLNSKEGAMVGLMFAAIILGALAFAFEILNCVTCCCLNRPLLHFAAVLIFLQALCMGITLIIFPSTFDNGYGLPSGTHIGWVMWVVIVGAVIAFLGAVINLHLYKKNSRRNDKF
eukprot:Nk52_evm86s223 gene=Nk52_evmTU86s223